MLAANGPWPRQVGHRLVQMERVRRPSISAVGQSVKTAAFAAAVVLAAVLIPAPEARAIVASAGVAILLVYVWAAGRHSRRARHALDSLIAMSTDLARAGDPNTVGDRMAAHLARAVKVDQCGICYWDEVSGQVITMGYYPPERRDPVGNSYLLADYPECERAFVSRSRWSSISTTRSFPRPSASTSRRSAVRCSLSFRS